MSSCHLSKLALTAALAASAAAQGDAEAARAVLGLDLTFASGAPATMFFHREHDPKRHHDTCKVFHHVRALDGTLLTKGNGGMFQHHKGLFIGWNRTKWNGQRFDFWHMPKQELQVFRGFLPHDAMNMAEGAQVCAIEWITPAGEVVIAERRGLQITEQRADSYTLHLRSELRAPNGKVRLAGDPQHSGQQLRSPQAFAPADATKVAYVRPDDARGHGNDVWTECEWIAAIQRHGADSYTILRVEGAGNRGETKWSTRDYGRFGATRAVDVTAAQPLVLDQYYVIADGARDAAWCAARAAAIRAASRDK
ncbi:MAG: hypothetical protein CMJ88_14910 [Planctomycetes bacterium]|nr:hypothetical protein [Planctomycetota bacterium]